MTDRGARGLGVPTGHCGTEENRHGASPCHDDCGASVMSPQWRQCKYNITWETTWLMT
jgi:hypothetical protein